MKTYWGVILNPLRQGGNKSYTYLNKCAAFI